MQLQELIDHFHHLYGRRNRICLRSLRKRIDLFQLVVGDLQDAIRKDVPQETVEVALARTVSRLFFIVDYFHPLPLVAMMARKYPAEACSYCQRSPCVCTEDRGGSKLKSEAMTLQLSWTLGDWCRHLDGLYGYKNNKRGIENMLNRLFREATEVSSLDLKLSAVPPTTLDAIEEAFALEISDALAWIIAVANFLHVNLEGSVLHIYGTGCPKCDQNPCVCTHVHVEQADWSKDGVLVSYRRQP